MAMLDWALAYEGGPVFVATPGGAVLSRPGDYAVDYASIMGYGVIN